MRSQSTEPHDDSQLAARLFPSPKGLDVFIRTIAQDCSAGGLPVLLAENSATRQAVLFRPRCKRWNCPECGQINTALWAWRASEGCRALFNAGHRLTFATVTPHPKLSAVGSLWVLPSAWKKLRMRLQRAAGGSCEYFAVPELHKTGKVHIHLLTNAMLKKRWWKDNAAACGFGYQSDAQEVVAVGGVASYVSKYLTKTLEFSNLPKATRRVRTSRGWPKLPEPEQQPGWQFTLLPKDAGMQDTAEVLMMRGYQVSIAGSKSAWKLLAATAEV